MKEKQEGTTYQEVDGDVIKLFFQSEGDAAILHGANCFKTMGAGIAAQIREKISPLFYLDQYDTRTPTQRLGSYSAVVIAQVEDKIKVGVNCYSQFRPGANFDLNAFINSMRSFTLSIPEDKRAGMTVFLPKIGCGIGGGVWKDVEPVVRENLKEFNIVVVNYKLISEKSNKNKK